MDDINKLLAEANERSANWKDGTGRTRESTGGGKVLDNVGIINRFGERMGTALILFQDHQNGAPLPKLLPNAQGKGTSKFPIYKNGLGEYELWPSCGPSLGTKPMICGKKAVEAELALRVLIRKLGTCTELKNAVLLAARYKSSKSLKTKLTMCQLISAPDDLVKEAAEHATDSANTDAESLAAAGDDEAA